MKRPMVSVIIVNYNGRHLLNECLSALLKTNFPSNQFEIIVVDNNSTDDSVTYLKKNFPEIKLISASENLGFTGGNNLGFEHSQGKFIALLNSDTRVTPNWLVELLKSAQSPQVGIVAPKLYYDLPFLEIEILSNVINKTDIDDSADFSPLGTLIEDISCQNTELSGKIWYKAGFYKSKIGNIKSRWTKNRAVVLLPFASKQAEEYSFVFHGYTANTKTNNNIVIKYKGGILLEDTLKPGQVKQYKLKIPIDRAKPYFEYLIQNTGNVVLKDGLSKDRGSVLRIKDQEIDQFYDLDSDFYNQPAKLLAFCGAGCLIKRELIEVLGFFNSHYFMYYEDIDLSLRAWRNGWDIVYNPKSVIFHKHQATTKSTESGFFLNLIERNHLSLVLVYFPIKVFAIELIKLIFRTSISWLRTVFYRLLDNIKTATVWETRTNARMDALKFITKHFLAICRERVWWQSKQQRTYEQMAKLLY